MSVSESVSDSVVDCVTVRRSQKCYKHKNNAGKTLNASKKFMPTENKLKTNRKSPKGRPDGKTVQRGRPSFSQARRQQGNKKFRFQFITRPDLHPADLIFVRTVNVDPHPADAHRAGHKKFDTLQTITVQTLFS